MEGSDIKSYIFKPSITKSMICGFVLVLLGFVILFTNYIDAFVTELLWPLLEGSSEGKVVLFLWLIGITLIFTSVIRQNSKLKEILYRNNDYHLKYLKITLLLLISCALIGLIIEALIRQHFGVSFFTVLTSMTPNTSTTSPMHSHAYKSVLGIFANYFVPAHVNTGASILQYVMPYALIIVFFWPVSYVLGVIGISNMRDLDRIVSIIALNVCLIGLIDGGIFSQPFLIGFAFLLLAYFSNGKIDLRKLFNKDQIEVKYFINPIIIMGFILLLAMIIEVGGSDTTCHTLTVVNQTDSVDMSEFNVTNMEVKGDMTIYTLNCSTPDKKLIREIFAKFKGKSDLTFMSWNFFTYLDNPTMRMRQNHS